MTDTTDSTSVTLSDGRVVTLREPFAADLRGIKLLDVLQLDAGAHAHLVPRISELSLAEFMGLSAGDTLRLMTEVLGFFGSSGLDLTGGA